MDIICYLILFACAGPNAWLESGDFAEPVLAVGVARPMAIHSLPASDLRKFVDDRVAVLSRLGRAGYTALEMVARPEFGRRFFSLVVCI